MTKNKLNESDASEEAKRKGLEYLSFGRYGKNGKVTHKVVNNKLEPVDKNDRFTKVRDKALAKGLAKGIDQTTIDKDLKGAEDILNKYKSSHPKLGNNPLEPNGWLHPDEEPRVVEPEKKETWVIRKTLSRPLNARERRFGELLPTKFSNPEDAKKAAADLTKQGNGKLRFTPVPVLEPSSERPDDQYQEPEDLGYHNNPGRYGPDENIKEDVDPNDPKLTKYFSLKFKSPEYERFEQATRKILRDKFNGDDNKMLNWIRSQLEQVQKSNPNEGTITNDLCGMKNVLLLKKAYRMFKGLKTESPYLDAEYQEVHDDQGNPDPKYQ